MPTPEDMLSELGDCDILSAWEQDFVGDLPEKLEQYGSLTEKQLEKLEDIYQKRVVDGEPPWEN